MSIKQLHHGAQQSACTRPIFWEAKKNFEKSREKIDHLWEIRNKMEGGKIGKPGKRANYLQVLHHAKIIMIIACWQAYVQDLFRKAFQYLLDHSDDPSKMPHDMKSDACQKIKENKDESFVWEFSGDGWKTMLEKYAEEKLDRFSSPSPEKIDNLFKYLGLEEELSESWSWQNMTSEQAKKKLNYYIKLRNEIAHGQKNDEGDSVNKKRAENCLTHIENLINKTEGAVTKYVKERIEQDANQ